MKLGKYLQLSELSQRDFGKMVGATQGMVSHVITGRSGLTARKIMQWCEVTGWAVTPHDIDQIAYPNPTDGLPTGVTLPPELDGKLNHENQSSD